MPTSPAAPTTPTTWVIDVDSIGAFRPPGVSTARQGNFRIFTSDVLTIFLPAGSLVNQDDVKLIIEDGAGTVTVQSGTADTFGNLHFRWTAPEASTGPATFTFDYLPFNVDKQPQQQRRRGVDNKLIVEPRLRINGVDVNPASICMQTVMSRCLGTLDTWSEKIHYATADLNYNVIHFTPVQTTGESGSCYSLADQLAICPTLLPPDITSAEDGFSLLRDVIRDIERKHGVLSTSDLVLNHTANDTRWLPTHPECGYNVRNSPHLQGAIDLDNALQEFSVKVSHGRFRSQNVPECIENEGALSNLRRVVDDVVLKPFKLHEWFQMDPEAVVQSYQKVTHAPPETEAQRKLSRQETINAMVKECLRTVGVARRCGVCPRPEVMKQLCSDVNDLRSVLKDVQQVLLAKAAEAHDNIINAIEGHVRWERVQCRKGPIGNSHWNALVPRYFTPVTLPSGEVLHLANNGWVMGWDAEEDFAAPGSLVYLNRSLVAWSDCVKLRYGEKAEDCPFLWKLMGEYAKRTAELFHGIRLDNCHSTPIHVAKCRKVNPNLWVYAELFTGKRETDLKFERELGLNALIREALQSYSAQSLCHHIEEFGGDRVGTLEPTLSLHRLADDGTPLRPLYPVLGPSLFFDCTHDNETPQQKRTAVDALPNAAAVVAACCGTGSCRGYDELVPNVLSVVTEKRLYHHYGPPREQGDSNTANSNSDSTRSTATTQNDPPRVVRFSTSLKADSSSLVIRGSWDGWKTDLPLTRRRGVWTADLPAEFYPTDAEAYKEYQYKFVADKTTWFHDPQLPWARDQHGNINNVISIGKDPKKGLHRPLTDCRQWSYGKPLPGIMEARKYLNDIHRQLGAEGGFTESDARLYGNNVIVVTRHQPSSHRLCVFFIHTAFSPGVLADPGHVDVTHELRGKVDEVLLEARLVVPEDAFFQDELQYINGLPSYLHVAGRAKGGMSRLGGFETRYDEAADRTLVTLTAFPPGSVVVLMTKGFRHVREAVANAILDIGSLPQGVPGAKISRSDELQAFSYLLYSCSNEERDRSRGARGCYELNEGIGELPYAGIAGTIPILDTLRCTRDLNHPLVKNILAGDWLFEYVADRLDTDRDDAFTGGVVVVLLKVATWIRETFREPLQYLPRNLLPYYFDWIVSSLYSWVAKRLLSGLPEPLRSSSDPFVVRLCLATLQFYSFVPSAPLIAGTNHASLCAGLPHFSTNYMRNWGRDTFIAFKGCLLVTGMYQEAREELLGYARVMRHGLIPNLQDSGNNPRYNARDASWFFLLSIQEYCSAAPEGTDFLKAPVSLKYAEAVPPGTEIHCIADLIHFILSSHAQGIQFREWNAGPKIDSCMRDEGFNIKIEMDGQTGLISGGNRFNCGTWMDKMGSSLEAGTMGIPATPRDGAAIEINGILKSVLRFVTSLSTSVFPYEVANPRTGLTYKEWHETLQRNLDSCFFVGTSQPGSNRVHIYKDTIGASDLWRDYQLRPNLCVALAAAPEAFLSEHACACLEQVSKDLFGAKTSAELTDILEKAKQSVGSSASAVHEWLRRGGIVPLFTQQLGLKTLDPFDRNYRPAYDNADRSRDPSVACGFSYHNGPEWVWPVGPFLEAKFKFERRCGNDPGRSNGASSPNDAESLALKAARFNTMKYLMVHREHIAQDKWLSLPELTNRDAAFCPFGCPAQAWSVATILAFITSIATSVPTLRSSSDSKGLLQSHGTSIETEAPMTPKPIKATDSAKSHNRPAEVPRGGSGAGLINKTTASVSSPTKA